jgi:hypothetical protein
LSRYPKTWAVASFDQMPGATSYGAVSPASGAVSFGSGFALFDAFVGALALRSLFLRKKLRDSEVLKESEVGKEDVRR